MKHDIIICPRCRTARLAKMPTCRKCGTPVVDAPKCETTTHVEQSRQRKRDRMSMTERRWSEAHPHHIFEPITLKMANGHKYTPDFVDWVNMCCIEVKGGYKLGSYQRAKLAYDQCRNEYPIFHFQWWTWKDNQWTQLED